MDTSEFVSAVTGRKLYPYQEQMLKLLKSQTFKSTFPRVSMRRTLCATPYLGIHGSILIDDLVESSIVKTSVPKQPRRRTTVEKLFPMGLQLVGKRELYTPGLLYFAQPDSVDSRQRSDTSEWSDWAPVR